MTARGAATATFDVEGFLRAGRDVAERALADLSLDGVPEPLHRPIGYALQAGGKRLRPILCAAAWRALRGTNVPPDVHRAASALELIHAYSLVHDDLPFMDDDDVRRGKPTTHRACGAATATMAGSAMIALAFRVLGEACSAAAVKREVRRDAIAALAHGAGASGMVGGQWLDLGSEGRALARSELESIHALKTGALIRAAAVLGGTLAGAGSAERAALADYGEAVGLAFQIADDLLDARGNSAAIGKTAGRDVELAKATYPALLGIGGAERLARTEVERALGALERADIRSPELAAIARYSIARTN